MKKPGMLRKRKSPNGIPTSQLVVTAHIGMNEDVLPLVMGLHVPSGAKVADVTYGKGIFWKNIPKGQYRVLATDLKTGVDCRSLPYKNETVDCVVLDPPYMEGLYRRATSHLAGLGPS